MLAEEKIACNQGTLYAPWSASPAADNKFYVSKSWPWELQEELSPHSVRSKVAALAAHESVSPFTSVAHRYKQQQPRPYSLSSRAEFSATASTSRSAISSSPYSASTSQYTALSSQSYATSSPAVPSDRVQQFRSLWDDEYSADESLSGKDAADQRQLPPVDLCDYMKTLLTQLGSSISSITTAYAHQQAAVHSHNVQAIATDHGRENGRALPIRAVISATDKAMVEALESLSGVHSQLALLPRRLPFKESGAKGGAEDMKEGESLQLRRYESIIARFHDEIWRKDAVVEALKETLAKSMLKGEKLQQRVHALEAQISNK